MDAWIISGRKWSVKFYIENKASKQSLKEKRRRGGSHAYMQERASKSKEQQAQGLSQEHVWALKEQSEATD